MCLLVSYKRNSTYDTYIGLGYVIKGVDKALLGLCTGEKITVTVPPHLAYGGDGVGEFPTTPRSLKIFSACDLSLLLLPPSLPPQETSSPARPFWSLTFTSLTSTTLRTPCRSASPTSLPSAATPAKPTI